MPNRRSQIAMTDGEMQTFLADSKTAVLTTLDRNGWPHSVAMWFVPPTPGEDGALRMWTYRKSQKTKNLERDPRAALLVETGVGYGELRGILVRAEIEVVDDFEPVRAIGLALHERYVGPWGGGEGDDAMLAEIERQARKRVGLIMPLERVASWDHRKLGG